MSHPVVMAGASGLSLYGIFGPASNYVLAVPGAVLASIMLYQMATKQPGFLGAVFARAKSVWTADRPYILMLGGFAFSAAQYFHYPIPTWALIFGASIGFGNLHASLTKGKTP